MPFASLPPVTTPAPPTAAPVANLTLNDLLADPPARRTGARGHVPKKEWVNAATHDLGWDFASGTLTAINKATLVPDEAHQTIAFPAVVHCYAHFCAATVI